MGPSLEGCLGIRSFQISLDAAYCLCTLRPSLGAPNFALTIESQGGMRQAGVMRAENKERNKERSKHNALFMRRNWGLRSEINGMACSAAERESTADNFEEHLLQASQRPNHILRERPSCSLTVEAVALPLTFSGGHFHARSSTHHPENVAEHQFCFSSCLTVFNVLGLLFSTRLNFMDCGLHLLLSNSCSTLDHSETYWVVSSHGQRSCLRLVIPNDCRIARLTPGLRASPWNQQFGSSFSPSRKTQEEYTSNGLG